MAHYDYRCPKCGVYEVEQNINEMPLTKCPKCGSEVKRLISASGIVFKGSGFYVTDHKKDGLHESKHIEKMPEPAKVTKPPEKPKAPKSS